MRHVFITPSQLMIWLRLLLLLLLLLGSLAAAPLPAGADPAPLDPETDSLTLEMMKESGILSRELKESSTPEATGIPPQHPKDDAWSGYLQLTQTDNPVISRACRQQALDRALAVTGGPSEVVAHIHERQALWREGVEGTYTIPRADYLAHIEECEPFCGPYIGGLLRCHIEAVREYPHLLVLFEIAYPLPDEPFQFHPADQDMILNFARQTQSEGKKLLLVGRASILGPHEDFAYNQSLARRRVDVVEDLLLQNGYPHQAVLKKPLAWEPPRLVASDIASAYGLAEEWGRQLNPQYMDQSVLIVAY